MSADLAVTIDMVPSLIGLSLPPLAEAICALSTRAGGLHLGGAELLTTHSSASGAEAVKGLMGGMSALKAAAMDLASSFGYSVGEGMGAVYA